MIHEADVKNKLSEVKNKLSDESEDETEDDCDDDDNFKLIFYEWPPKISVFGTSGCSLGTNIGLWQTQKHKNRLKRSTVKELLLLKIHQKEKAKEHPIWLLCNAITLKPWENAERILNIFRSLEENERFMRELCESRIAVRIASQDVEQNRTKVFKKIQKREDVLSFDDDKDPTKQQPKLIAGRESKLQTTTIRKQPDSQSQETTASELSDVMISYNWASGKEIALRIYADLIASGYKVWIDEEEMEVQMHSSMEKAIRNSKIILPILSKGYETSSDCLLEFNYAYDLKKKTIPIFCEKEYKAEGPVRMKTTGLMYFDLSRTGDYDKDEKNYVETLFKLAIQINKLVKQSP